MVVSKGVIVMNLPGWRATIQSSHRNPGETGMKILTQSLILAGLLYGNTVFAADAPVQGFDVLDSMSVAQFRGAGLEKLSDSQLKALNTWFNQYLQQQAPVYAGAQPASPAAVAPAMAAPAAAPVAAAPVAESISAHIAGEFHGWSGGTRFSLDNGQVWEQIDDTVVTAGRLTNPKVTISRGLFNSYYMSVEGVTDTVQVKRIQTKP
jgi:biotin carboxyl carrier protein